MEQHELEQGSDAWHNFRAQHHGASECAAMLGLSKKTTRTELLHMKHTGIGKEFSAWVQEKILDHGHTVEALARPLVEKIIGKKLYPVTCSEGRLSASCDGLTMDEKIGFEHKQWNEKYAAMVADGIVPEEHMPQCQQVLMVTGAQMLYFVISDGTRENMGFVVVGPDPVWFERIRAGWAQFEKDLAAYVPPEVIEKPQAEAIKDLPAVTIQVTGELTKCNLDAVTPQFDRYLEEAGSKLATIDIANGKAVGKFSRETAKALKNKAQDVVDQIATVSEAVKTLTFYAEQFDAMGLKYEKATDKLEKAETEAAIGKVTAEYMQHVEALEAETAPVRLSVAKPNFAGALKSLRTIESKNNALNQALANGKIAADAQAKELRAKLAWYKANAGSHWFLFNDFATIIYKAEDDFKLLVNSRIADHTAAEAAKLEAERERIRAEEEKKAEAKVLAEKLSAAHAQQHSESLRVAIEHVAAKGEAAVKTSIAESGSPEISVHDIRPPKCDGDHPSPPCADAQCWNNGRPTGAQIIEAVALAFGVAESTAAEWLVKEFQARAA